MTPPGPAPGMAMRISRNVAVFLLAALAALGSLLVIRALREQPTDEELIQALLERATGAVEEKRPGDVMAGVSERFQGEGMGYRELKQFVTYQVLRGSWNAVVPVSVKVKIDGDRAETTFDAALIRGGKGEGLVARLPEAGDAWRIEATLEREKEGWKVVSARWRRTTGPR
jgi:hypothetical protein